VESGGCILTAASKYSGAFSVVIDDRPVLVFLLGSLNVFYRSLHWQNMSQHMIGSTLASVTESFNTTESFEVLGSDTFASAWVSVAVLDNNLTALYIDTATSSVAVGFFRLIWASPTELALQERSMPVSLGQNWDVHMHAWQDYARIVVSRHTENTLVVSVEIQTSEELRATALMLRVCVCAQNRDSVCSVIILSEMSVSIDASFISAAYLQQAAGEELWAVSVNGKTHKAVFAQDTLMLARVLATDLENKHFVKVDHLFYCFVVSDSGDAVQPSVLTYLPHFKSWRSSTHSSLPAVYAVVIVPLGVSQNASDLSSDQSYTSDQSSDLSSDPSYASDQYSDKLELNMSSSNSSVAEPESETTRESEATGVLKKILRLQLRWASYSVPAFGHAAQPLSERTAEAASGDELTQLLVSPHVINPRAQSPRTLLASYAITSNNITLNRAFGLPREMMFFIGT